MNPKITLMHDLISYMMWKHALKNITQPTFYDRPAVRRPSAE